MENMSSNVQINNTLQNEMGYHGKIKLMLPFTTSEHYR